MSDERINSINASNYSITPSLDYLGAKITVNFNGSCLKQDKITYTHDKIVNIYIVYEISKNVNISNYPTLENCLFGAVSLTKNVDTDNLNILDMVLDLIEKRKFSVGNGFIRNCINFGVDMSSSVHVDSKKKDILILGKGPTQKLDGTTLTAEKNVFD